MSKRRSKRPRGAKTDDEKAVEVPSGLKLHDWFKEPSCEQIARRQDVWALLRWYHHSVVIPNRGVYGFLRRLIFRVTGQKQMLMSPWEQIAGQIAEYDRRRKAEEALGIGNQEESRDDSRPRIVDP